MIHLAYLLTLTRSYPEADPDLEISGEGEPGLKKGRQFGLTIRGWGQSPLGPSPGYTTAFQPCLRVFVNWSGEGRRRNEFAEWHVAWLAE